MVSAVWQALVLGLVLTASNLADPIQRFERDNGENCRTQTDILFVLDSSGSITESNWPKVLEFVKRVVLMWDIGPDKVRIGIVTFGNKAYPQFQLNTYETKDEILSAIDDVEWKNENTNTSGAIRYMCDVAYTVANGDRPESRNIAFIMTDGKSSVDYEGEQTIPNARAAREKGVSIFAIGVGDQYDRAELFAIAGSKGRDETSETMPTVDGMAAVIDVEDFDSLEEIESSVVAGTINCEIPDCREENDIVIVVDVSVSMSKHTIGIRDFLFDFIPLYIPFGQDYVTIALISYSDVAQLHFDLARYDSTDDVTNAIMEELVPLYGETNTGSAFRLLKDEVLLESRGLRPLRRQIVLLFTDGNSNDMDDTLESAAELKKQHVEIIVISVGNWVNLIEVNGIASDPDSHNVFIVSDTEELGTIADSLHNVLCVANNNCSSNPCMNDGDCRSLVNNYYCECRRFYLGRNCEYYCPIEADVLFLLDSSGSLGQQGFHDLVGATNQLALLLHSEQDDIGIALETFADTTVMVLDLNDRIGKLSQLSSLIAPYNAGSTDTAMALDMMTYFFNINKKPVRVAVIMTDGKSNDFIRTFKAAAMAHSMNVHIITAAVNVHDQLGRLELRGLTSDPDVKNLFFYNTTNALLTDVSPIKNSMMEAICNDVDECQSEPCQNRGSCIDGIFEYSCECPEGYTGVHCERECDGRMDIVFALDASGSIRRSRFPYLKQWVYDFVTQLEIRKGRTRVGVVLFNNVTTIAFNLNDFTEKQDVLQAIDILEWTGGQTNIAAAISVMRSMLTPAKKDRITTTTDIKRVAYPRYAIILTDGQPTVDVLGTPVQAIQARLEAIKLVLVATESKFENELFRLISNDPDPSFLFTVKRFSDLQSVLDSVIKTTCDTINECLSNPCLRRAQCFDQIDRYTCVCPKNLAGVNCQKDCVSRIDLALVFDSSGSVEEYFQLAQNESRRIIEELSVHPDNARIAAVTFHDFATVEFNFDRYNSTEGVLNAIDFIHHGGASNLHGAMELLLSQIFNGENGDRLNARNVVMIFTDGTGYTKTATEIAEVVQTMTSKDIIRIAVALGEEADLAYLQTLVTPGSRPDSNVRTIPSGDLNLLSDRTQRRNAVHTTSGLCALV